ncbi:hypothetical protein MTO96_015503 [Rhipicephalus appendiculatus]
MRTPPYGVCNAAYKKHRAPSHSGTHTNKQRYSRATNSFHWRSTAHHTLVTIGSGGIVDEKRGLALSTGGGAQSEHRTVSLKVSDGVSGSARLPGNGLASEATAGWRSLQAQSTADDHHQRRTGAEYKRQA